MTFSELNHLPEAEARRALGKCCGSSQWVDLMLAMRPFKNRMDILLKAQEVWTQDCDEEDWREAFSHHPKIGDLENLRERFGDSAEWSGSEQAEVSTAAEEVLQRLADKNAAYEDRFGYIFIVCATGKSALEMLGLLEERLRNPPDEEIQVAMTEQMKITELRLEKLLS